MQGTRTSGVEGADRLAAVLTRLRDAVGRPLELQTAIILARLAETGEAAMSDLQREAGLSSAAISRNIALLADAGYATFNYTGKSRVPGLGWVQTYEDPNDRRHKRVRLTPAGLAAMTKALAPLNRR